MKNSLKVSKLTTIFANILTHLVTARWVTMVAEIVV